MKHEEILTALEEISDKHIKEAEKALTLMGMICFHYHIPPNLRITPKLLYTK